MVAGLQGWAALVQGEGRPRVVLRLLEPAAEGGPPRGRVEDRSINGFYRNGAYKKKINMLISYPSISEC